MNWETFVLGAQVIAIIAIVATACLIPLMVSFFSKKKD